MSRASDPRRTASPAVFRVRLLVATMLAVSGGALLVLGFAERRIAANVGRELQIEFQGAVASLNNAEEVRQAVIVERCRALARRPRIHAALEDGALDLLYPSARDELGDLMSGGDAAAGPSLVRADFYRFLGPDGKVILPAPGDGAGPLAPAESARLSLPALPPRQEIGFLWRAPDLGKGVREVITTPIVSADTGEVIAALVVGIEPRRLGLRPDAGIRSGLWLDGRLDLPGVGAAADAGLAREVSQAIARPGSGASPSFPADVGGTPNLVFFKRLNPGSALPPAFEVCVYPMTELASRLRALRWEVAAAAAAILLCAFAASQALARGFSRPVEILTAESERSARFSADASHQLKTPVTVLRAGLEELLAREHWSADECAEIAALIHQTYRLSTLIEDLLLLSRMDAGRLRIDFGPVDLRLLIETGLDDLSAVPDSTALAIEIELPDQLVIAGDKIYTAVILQNLLENARKYNRPGGRIRVTAREEGPDVLVAVGNTGRPIPPEAQAHVFERFHRARMGEDVPGYGLGLNLARELARIHRGDLRLARSAEDWTEFEARFLAARPADGSVTPS